MRAYAHDRFHYALPDGHRFPLGRYRLLREAIESWTGSKVQKSALIVATKGGITRGPATGADDAKGIGEAWGKSATYDYLMRAIAAAWEASAPAS